jgi:hypothetical protein
MTVDSSGKDVNKNESGDADGDGLLWSPVAGAANRVWETTLWYRYPGLKSYKDSAVKVLSGPGGSDARVAYYGAISERGDGTRLVLALRSADGTQPFGPADTALLVETLVHPPSDPEGRDSTVRTATLIPGRLDTDADDRLLGWTSKAYFRAPAAVASRGENFKSDAPMAPGTLALAGSYVTEEKRRDAGEAKPEDLSRTWSRHDFDRTTGASAWKTVRVKRSGDSTVAQGGRGSAGEPGYATWAGKGFKATGIYDPATGSFQDTLSWMGADGKPAGKRVSKGGLKDGAGEYAAVVTRADGRVRSVKVKAVKEADGWTAFTRMEGTDTAAWRAKGDSVVAERRIGKARVEFRMGRKPGRDYAMAVAGTEGSGSGVLRADIAFEPGGTGAGTVSERVSGTWVNRPFRSDPDGTVHLDSKTGR